MFYKSTILLLQVLMFGTYWRKNQQFILSNKNISTVISTVTTKYQYVIKYSDEAIMKHPHLNILYYVALALNQ